MKFTNCKSIAISKFKINNKVIFNTWNIKTTQLYKSLKYKNANFYKIIRTINNYVYELKLLKLIKLI